MGYWSCHLAKSLTVTKKKIIHQPQSKSAQLGSGQGFLAASRPSSCPEPLTNCPWAAIWDAQAAAPGSHGAVSQAGARLHRDTLCSGAEGAVLPGQCLFGSVYYGATKQRVLQWLSFLMVTIQI